MWPSSPKTEAATSADSTTPEPLSIDTPVEGSRSELPDEIALPGPESFEQTAEPIVAETLADDALTEPAAESELPTAPTSASESDPSNPVWPSFPSYDSTDDQAAPSWYAQDFPSATNAAAPATDTVVEQHVAERPTTTSEPVAHAHESERDPIAAFVGRYRAANEPTASSDDTVTAPIPQTESNDSDDESDSTAGLSSESLERAQSLLAELGALLPTLSSGAGAVSNDLSNSIAETLSAAQSHDETAFDALTEAVAAVRARPRDIDVVLDLARHVEAIVDLKDGYDQSQAAIGEALSRLNNQ
jgi:hypothetical protein